MSNILLTLIVVALMALTVLWRVRRVPAGEGFMEYDNSKTIKALAALQVLMGHIPDQYGNPLESMIQSTGYVVITIFYIYSGYGMMLGALRKGAYLKGFWHKRLVSLLIPMLLINIVCLLIRWLTGVEVDNHSFLRSLLNINYYIVILLQYCVAFWVVMWCRARLGFSFKGAGVALMVIVLASSLANYCYNLATLGTSAGPGWSVERLGLMYGLVLALWYAPLKRLCARHGVAITVVSALVSLVLAYLYQRYKAVPFTGDYLLRTAQGLAIVIFVMVASSGVRIINPLSRFIASISYEMYLLHAFLIVILAALLPGLSSGLFILGVYVTTIPLAWVVRRLYHPLARLLGVGR